MSSRSALASVFVHLFLLTARDPTGVPAAVHGLAEGAEELKRRLDELADFHEVLSGAIVLAPEECVLGELVAATVDDLGERLQPHPLEINVDLTVRAAVDRRRFGQAVGHVLENVARWSPKDAPIQVEVAGGGGVATVAVRDHGTGVAEDRRRDLLRPFSHRNTAIGRTGIGLSMAAALVELHGGTIDLERAPGGGSLLVIRLPVERTAEVASPVVASAASGVRTVPPRRTGAADGRSQPLTVLCVDDDRGVAGLVERVLAVDGEVRVHHSEDPQSAHRQALRYRPDVILLDLQLAASDGEEVLRELRATSGWRTCRSSSSAATPVAGRLRCSKRGPTPW